MNLQNYRTAIFKSSERKDEMNHNEGEYTFIFSPSVKEEEMKKFAEMWCVGELKEITFSDGVDYDLFKDIESVSYYQDRPNARWIFGHQTEYYTKDGDTTDYYQNIQRIIDMYLHEL